MTARRLWVSLLPVILARIALAIGPAAATPPAGPPGRRLALLIAVQGYGRFGKEWQNLDGPINDVALMRQVLSKRFGFAPIDITMVCDDQRCSAQPTRKGIDAAITALIQRAQPGDLVYIHYSGHGSTVPDANGDEGRPEGRDSTLVPIDARAVESREILDDEISIWLSRLREKGVEDVVLVVDACHSGTITRGARSAKTRGAPTTDSRDYSWSKRLLEELKGAKPPVHFVRVSATRDNQRAYEYEAPDKKSYGRFTWFWAKGLQAAARGQTYDAVYRSVAAMMPPQEQQPVIEGATDLALFQARFAEYRRQIAVTNVSPPHVDFDEGLLNGMTVGSTFEHVMAGAAAAHSRVSVRIDSVGAYSSRGTICSPGRVKPGDLFEETRHVYKFTPLRVSVRTDNSKDGAVKKTLQDAMRALGDAVEVVPEGQRAEVILHLARVSYGPAGQPLIAADGLPTRGATDAPLECWILDDAEQLYAPDLRIPIADMNGAQRKAEANDPIDIVKRNVGIILRNRGILEVAAQGATESTGEISIEALRLTDPRGGESAGDLVEIPFAPEFGGKKQQRIEPSSPGPSGEVELTKGDFITFRVANRSHLQRYFYLINIAPSGEAQVIFPVRGFDDNAKVTSESVQVLREATVKVDGPRDTYIWFITDVPSNVWALEGTGFETGRGQGQDRGIDSALAQLLRQAGGLTRGTAAVGKGSGEFASRKVVVRVR